MPFKLTNKQRKYLGLTPVEDTWDEVIWGKTKFDETIILYFEGDKLVKQITLRGNGYREMEVSELTTENRTIILPKTAKGKPRKLNYTGLSKINGIGVYFSGGGAAGNGMIGNYSTQRTFYCSRDMGTEEPDGLSNVEEWLDWWINDTTEADLQELEAFKAAKRQRCKYKEGDFFAFKTGRREYGFGRILLDVYQFKKTAMEKHYGLGYMGRPLIIKVYNKTSDSIHVDLDELKQCEALPSQPILDNVFFYGECPIIGNLPLEPEELEFPISYSRSRYGGDFGTVYLQYGLIYLEKDISEYSKYLQSTGNIYVDDPFRCEEIGYNISQRWEPPHNLQSPQNKEIKREIFADFGLDADKSYYENYETYLSTK